MGTLLAQPYQKNAEDLLALTDAVQHTIAAAKGELSAVFVGFDSLLESARIRLLGILASPSGLRQCTTGEARSFGTHLGGLHAKCIPRLFILRRELKA